MTNTKQNGRQTSAKCSKYHAKCKVTMPKCSKYHAKWQVLVPNCCKYMANGTGKESQKQIQNLRQKKKQKHPKTILPYFLDVRSGLHSFTMDQGSHIKQELNIGISPTNMGPNMRKDKDTQIWAGAWLMGMWLSIDLRPTMMKNSFSGLMNMDSPTRHPSVMSTTICPL